MAPENTLRNEQLSEDRSLSGNTRYHRITDRPTIVLRETIEIMRAAKEPLRLALISEPHRGESVDHGCKWYPFDFTHSLEKGLVSRLHALPTELKYKIFWFAFMAWACDTQFPSPKSPYPVSEADRYTDRYNLARRQKISSGPYVETENSRRIAWYCNGEIDYYKQEELDRIWQFQQSLYKHGWDASSSTSNVGIYKTTVYRAVLNDFLEWFWTESILVIHNNYFDWAHRNKSMDGWCSNLPCFSPLEHQSLKHIHIDFAPPTWTIEKEKSDNTLFASHCRYIAENMRLHTFKLGLFLWEQDVKKILTRNHKPEEYRWPKAVRDVVTQRFAVKLRLRKYWNSPESSFDKGQEAIRLQNQEALTLFMMPYSLRGIDVESVEDMHLDLLFGETTYS